MFGVSFLGCIRKLCLLSKVSASARPGVVLLVRVLRLAPGAAPRAQVLFLVQLAALAQVLALLQLAAVPAGHAAPFVWGVGGCRCNSKPSPSFRSGKASWRICFLQVGSLFLWSFGAFAYRNWRVDAFGTPILSSLGFNKSTGGHASPNATIFSHCCIFDFVLFRNSHLSDLLKLLSDTARGSPIAGDWMEQVNGGNRYKRLISFELQWSGTAAPPALRTEACKSLSDRSCQSCSRGLGPQAKKSWSKKFAAWLLWLHYRSRPVSRSHQTVVQPQFCVLFVPLVLQGKSLNGVLTSSNPSTQTFEGGVVDLRFPGS